MRRIGNRPKGLAACLTGLLVPVLSLAQPEIQVSLDAKQVLVQETFTWKLEVEGSDDMPQLSFPDINGLAIVSGPMQSSNYTYVNGKMSAKKSLSYTFVALEPGKIVFPPMEVFLGSKRYITKALTVDVVSSAKPGSRSGAEQGQSVYLKAIPSKRNIFLGEPISVQYKLFTKVGVYNYQVDKLPDAVGFWAEEVPQSSQPRLISEVIDGERYNTAVLKTVLYYPTRSGELVIDPLKTELEIEVKSNQKRRRVFNDPFFNDPFFSGTQRATRNFVSNPVNINVKPLPEPKPGNFSGAVGKFLLKAQLDTSAVFANDAVGLTLSLSGSGNFKSIQLPEPQLPEGVDVFKPERSEDIQINGMRHSGSKKATYLLVPRKSGKLSIPAIELSYFDVNRQAYVDISTKPMTLNVYDATGAQPVVTSGYSREEVSLMQDDIRFIKAIDSDLPFTEHLRFGMLFWLLHGGGAFLVVGLIIYQNRQDKVDGNKDLKRSLKAMRSAKRALHAAAKLPEDSSELRSRLHQVILGYIGARLQVSENALELESLMQALEARAVDDGLISETRTFLEGLTMDRFAPGSVQRSAIEWVQATRDLLRKLGRAI